MSAPAGGGNLAPEDPPPLLRRPRIRLLLVVVGVAMLLVAGAGGLFLERQRAYDQNIQRILGAFPAEPARPARVPGRAQNWLLVGSDRRADQGTTGQDAEEPLWRYGAQRADTIMLVHLPADRKRIYLVSFPRDATTIQGHGNAKLNAAFSFGGPPLLIATMERLTGAGRPLRDPRLRGLQVHDGCARRGDRAGGPDGQGPGEEGCLAGGDHLDGARALDFVRRVATCLPGGDLGRIRRIMPSQGGGRPVVDKGTLANPLKLNAFLEASTRSVSVDESLAISGLRSLALQFRSVRASDVVFVDRPGRRDRNRGAPERRLPRPDQGQATVSGAAHRYGRRLPGRR